MLLRALTLIHLFQLPNKSRPPFFVVPKTLSARHYRIRVQRYYQARPKRFLPNWAVKLYSYFFLFILYCKIKLYWKTAFWRHQRKTCRICIVSYAYRIGTNKSRLWELSNRDPAAKHQLRSKWDSSGVRLWSPESEKKATEIVGDGDWGGGTPSAEAWRGPWSQIS